MKKHEVQEKAAYCLQCAKPQCKLGCPLGNNIPQMIEQIKNEEYEKAYYILSETTVLSAVCGAICPHQKQCEGKCIRGYKGESVAIGELEEFVGNWALENKIAIPKSDKQSKGKIAIVGSGPSGLTCATFLKKAGLDVTIYEKYETLGGILQRGIPEFRLPKKTVENIIKQITNLGIVVKVNQELGKNLSLEELEKEYDVIFLSIGANVPRKMLIEGEELEGVYGGNSLLELENHPDYKGKQIAVIGGGNVAMDCARTIKRLGAKKVFVIYRRGEEQMPAEQKEIQEAKAEGIEFLFQTNITKILGNEKVERIECIKCKLIEKEGETRKVSVPIENTNYEMPMNYVIMAVGGKVNKPMLEDLKLEITDKKYLKINQNHQTSHEKVFAGGDLVGRNSTVAWAARDGREAAEEIILFLKNKEVGYEKINNSSCVY